MPRIHAFEFNDTAQCPQFFRDSIVEILGNTLKSGKIYDTAVPLFSEFCSEVQCETVLDLCSGSGEPISILIEALKRRNEAAPNFLISDRFPNVPTMRTIAARYPGKVEVVTEPVDATDVPAEYDQKACTIISAFHHFTPELASQILSDCVKKRRAVFILEPFPRDVRCVTPILLSGIIPLLKNPIVAKKHRFLKALFTYGNPTILLMGIWDAVISSLRVYTEDELMDIVRPLKGEFQWEYRQIPIALGGAITVFTGIPLEREA